MGTKSRRNRSKEPNGSASTTGGQNGHSNGSMNNNVEYRRKNASLDTPAVTANLMARDSFSLDDHVPRTPTMNNHGFFQLPVQDRRNFGLLVLLYFLQGVPMGLATGSVPFLLKPSMSYGALGVFSLASYPYSLKLLWSPIVDACWSPKVGRRKSWIMPIQMELKGVYRREASMCCCRRALEDSLASKVHGPWYSFLTGAGVDHQARTRIKRTWPL